MAVVSAARRPNAVSPRSWISSGLGTSISATRLAGAPADLLAHRVAPGLERAHQALGLLLEDLAALVEPLAGAPLRLVRELLSATPELSAVLGQELARLRAGLRRHQQRDPGADNRAEQEPAHVAALIIAHGDLLVA